MKNVDFLKYLSWEMLVRLMTADLKDFRYISLFAL